eukprot:scaffold15914_cov140-Skeletonema_marinoi.AAC.1
MLVQQASSAEWRRRRTRGGMMTVFCGLTKRQNRKSLSRVLRYFPQDANFSPRLTKSNFPISDGATKMMFRLVQTQAARRAFLRVILDKS